MSAWTSRCRRSGPHRLRVQSARELRQFLDAVQSDRLAALWRVAATTGMRRGELLGLTWRALYLDGASLRVEQRLIPTAGGCTFGAAEVPPG